MAGPSGKKAAAGSLAGAGRPLAEADATARIERAAPRKRSDRRLETNRRRLYCGALGAGEFARRCPFRSGSATGAALSVRANLERGNPTEAKAALRDENHSRNPVPRRLISGMIIRQIFISPGHNYFGRHGQAPDNYPLVEVEQIDCVAGHGIRGDRFYDYRDD